MAQQRNIGNPDNSQTAVQQLIKWAESLKFNTQQCIDWICIKEKAEELLQMEKEQIIDSYGIGHNDGCAYMTDGKTEFEGSEQYYNETFGKS